MNEKKNQNKKKLNEFSILCEFENRKPRDNEKCFTCSRNIEIECKEKI